MSRIVITGAGGNLGQSIANRLDIARHDIIPITRDVLDLTASEAVIYKVLDELNPHYIVNCAAYTQVDKAEDEPALAHRVNAHAPAAIAKWVEKHNRYLIHFSTDYVFNGEKSMPYTVEDETDPINIYGASKLAGEQAVLEIAPDHAMVLRISWVFGEYGHNFVPFVINAFENKQRVKAITDQMGSPTYTQSVAKLIADPQFFYRRHTGLFHSNNKGATTRYDQACFIARAMGLDANELVEPVESSTLHMKAKRPYNTAMICNFPLDLPEWPDATEQYLKRLGVATSGLFCGL